MRHGGDDRSAAASRGVAARGVARLAGAAARAAACLAASLAAPVGCDSISERERAESPTGGVEMSLQILRTGEQQYEFYRVTARGELEYGGGMRAFNESTSWKTPLAEAEIRDFLAELARTGWCEHEPADDPESPTRVSIVLRCDSGRHT